MRKNLLLIIFFAFVFIVLISGSIFFLIISGSKTNSNNNSTDTSNTQTTFILTTSTSIELTTVTVIPLIAPNNVCVPENTKLNQYGVVASNNYVEIPGAYAYEGTGKNNVSAQAFNTIPYSQEVLNQVSKQVYCGDSQGKEIDQKYVVAKKVFLINGN